MPQRRVRSITVPFAVRFRVPSGVRGYLGAFTTNVNQQVGLVPFISRKSVDNGRYIEWLVMESTGLVSYVVSLRCHVMLYDRYSSSDLHLARCGHFWLKSSVTRNLFDVGSRWANPLPREDPG